MYLTSHYNKVNFRRFYENIGGQAQDKNGHKITIEEQVERDTNTGAITVKREVYTDYEGECTRKITRENGKIKSDEMFGDYERLYKNGKVVKETFFVKGSMNSKSGLQTDRTEKLFGEKIKCLSWYSRGSLYKQVAYYTNNRKAYHYSKGSKKPLLLYRKTGELWARYAGAPVNYSPNGCIFNAGQYRYSYRNEGKTKQNTPADISGSGNFSIEVYTRKGVIDFRGQYENSQKTGEWLKAGALTYYISGVEVSKEIYKCDPQEWNADEVLGIENAQLRASLLKKFTYERLLQRKQGRIVDTDKSNDRDNSIMEFTNPRADNSDDKIIRVLKVCCPTTRTYYALRIPPNVGTCEVARSWTFNVDVNDNNTISDADLVKFARET